MLSERQLRELLKVFNARFQAVVEEYLTLMGEHLRDIGRLTETDVHRLKQLKRMNANVEAIKKKIAQAAAASVEDVEKVFQAVAESNLDFANAMFAESHDPGVKVSPIKTLSSPMERILKAQLRITAQSMANLSQTTILSDGYKAAVDVAVQTVQSGLTDYSSAIRRALKEAAAEGLRVQYQSGLTRRLDTAVRQNILDGVRALNHDTLNQLGKEFGSDGVEISAHMLCATDHLPYQGLQFSNKEFDRIQNTLDRPFGMWNCKHTMYPILLGISEPSHTREELEMYRNYSQEAVTIDDVTMSRYEWSQQQRRIETAVREQKNIANGAKAAGDSVLRREAQRNINRLQAQYAKISDAAGLTPEKERMAVAGFRKVKTADELKKPVKDATISKDTSTNNEGVHMTFDIDVSNYKIISPVITTTKVVLTEERILHIQERHPGDWEKYGHLIADTITDPNYVLSDKNPDTAICIKQVSVDNEIKHLRTTLRLHTPNDEAGKSNSILTFQKINRKEYGRLSRNKNVVYKKE